MHDALNRVTEVVRSNGTKTEVSYDAEDHITKIVNTCGSCGKVNITVRQSRQSGVARATCPD